MWNVCSTLLLPSLLIGARAATTRAPAAFSPNKDMWVIRSPLTLFTRTDQDGWCSIRNPVYPLDDVDKLEEATMPKVDDWVNKKILDGSNNGCTMDNAVVRREW